MLTCQFLGGVGLIFVPKRSISFSNFNRIMEPDQSILIYEELSIKSRSCPIGNVWTFLMTKILNRLSLWNKIFMLSKNVIFVNIQVILYHDKLAFEVFFEIASLLFLSRRLEIRQIKYEFAQINKNVWSIPCAKNFRKA